MLNVELKTVLLFQNVLTHRYANKTHNSKLKTHQIGRNRVTRSVNAPPPVSPNERTRTM